MTESFLGWCTLGSLHVMNVTHDVRIKEDLFKYASHLYKIILNHGWVLVPSISLERIPRDEKNRLLTLEEYRFI